MNGFISVYNGTKQLVLFGPEKYDTIFSGIRYLIRVRNGITYIISHYYDLCDSLPIEKNFTSHNVLILTESVFNKDKNNYCFHIFLGKGSYEIPKITIINKFLCKLQMLYYDRIGIRIDINKTSALKKV